MNGTLEGLGPNGKTTISVEAIKQNPNGWTVSKHTACGSGPVQVQRKEGSNRLLIISWPVASEKRAVQGRKFVTMS